MSETKHLPGPSKRDRAREDCDRRGFKLETRIAYERGWLDGYAAAGRDSAAPALLEVCKQLEAFHSLGPNIQAKLRTAIALAEEG